MEHQGISADDVRREASILHSLCHKNVVRYVGVYGSEDTDDEMGIIMELMTGGSITDFIKKRTSSQVVPTEQVFEMIMQMAGAMDYIHGQGILHRDIKSDNILFAHAHMPGSEKPMSVKLADFGVAVVLATNAGSARFSKPGGTEMYYAPERGNGESYGAMADMFSLGCVVAEICTLTLLVQPIWQYHSPQVLERRQSLFEQVATLAVQCVAACCRLLPSVVVRCRVLPGVAVYVSMLRHVTACCILLRHVAACGRVLLCVTVCCRVLPCVLPCEAMYCSIV
jgi:serine/threonine protein kinase